ncbi:MAG: hypothetical protein AAGF56_04785 [Pseudomonadota bacterium]
MPPRMTTRYRADPDVLATLKRDGMGWGHDLTCGCFRDTTLPARTGPIARITAMMNKRN